MYIRHLFFSVLGIGLLVIIFAAWTPVREVFIIQSINRKAGFHVLLPYNTDGSLLTNIDQVDVDTNHRVSFTAPLQHPPTFSVFEKASSVYADGLDWYTPEELRADGFDVATISVHNTLGLLITTPKASETTLRFSNGSAEVAIHFFETDLGPRSTEAVVKFANSLR